jgi:hypothetical protein
MSLKTPTLVLAAFILILSSLSGFHLPSSDTAILDHFLAMTPKGIWSNIVQQEDSPIRHAYYLKTSREGFVSNLPMAFIYLSFLAATIIICIRHKATRR